MKTAADYCAAIAAALEMGPNTWDCDSNETPFYNDADGHSRGGDPDGTYCLFGEPFEIDGELYDPPVLVDRCGKADAEFISACHPLALRSILESHAQSAIAVAKMVEEVERVRQQLAELSKDAERYRWLTSELADGRKTSDAEQRERIYAAWVLLALNDEISPKAEVDAAIDAALKDPK